MRSYKKPWQKTAVTCLCLLFGNMLLAFAVGGFIIPHDIIMGGTTGIGIVLNRAFPQIEVSVFVLVLNLLLLVLALFVLGKKFVVTTVASSILYPLFLGVVQRIPGIENMTDDTLLAAIFGGVLLGISLGIVMRVGSSTGGIDIVNLVLNKWFHYSVAFFTYITDFIIIGGQALFSPAEKTLCGIVTLVLETWMLNETMILGKAQIQLYVVSREFEKIREAILTTLEAGVTMHYIEAGLLGEEQKSLLCVIPQRKLYAATELIRGIDPEAFITVTQIKEVRGRGFTTERIRKEIPKR